MLPSPWQTHFDRQAPNVSYPSSNGTETEAASSLVTGLTEVNPANMDEAVDTIVVGPLPLNLLLEASDLTLLHVVSPDPAHITESWR